MITLYSQSETDFSHNGLGVVNASSATLTHELNGMYELQLVTTAKRSASIRLDEMTVVKAPTPDGMQLFRIYKVNKDISNVMVVNARHIFYDNLYNNIVSYNPVNATADAVIKGIFSNAEIGMEFSASSNVGGANSFEFSNINPVAAILDKGGAIDKFGGELSRDNRNVSLLASIGRDRGFFVRYRKNMLGLNVETDIEGAVTRATPIAQTSNGSPLYLPEKHIDSPNISIYPFPLLGVLDCSDIRVGEEGMTAQKAYTEMRRRVAEAYDNGLDERKMNAKVDFILLRDTGQYANYAFLEDIHIGDTVTVVHEDLNVDLKAKCIKYDYDVVLERYSTIELGAFRDNYTSSFERDIANVSVNTSETGAAVRAHIADEVVHLTTEQKAWIVAQMAGS